VDSVDIYSYLLTHHLYLSRKPPWYCIKLEVLVAIKILSSVLGVVTLCGLVAE
jgi:hypothetical protein